MTRRELDARDICGNHLYVDQDEWHCSKQNVQD